MDNFAEQLVVKHQSSSDRMKKMAVFVIGCLMTILLAVVAVLTLGSGTLISMIALILAAATGFGTYYFMQESYVEYEYTFTNGELDIDKIVAKKKRIELVTLNVKNFKDFGKYFDAPEENEDMTVIFATDNIESHEYYADFDHESYGSSRLVFAPNERMLENISRSLPAALRKKMK